MSPPITTTTTYACGFIPPSSFDSGWDPPFSGPPGGINVPAIRGIGTSWASRDSFTGSHYTFQILYLTQERAAGVMTIGVMRDGSNVRALRGYLSFGFTLPTPPPGRDIRIDDAYFSFRLSLLFADPAINEEDAFIESAHSRVSINDRSIVILLLNAPIAGHTAPDVYNAATVWATAINRDAVPAAKIKITDATAAPPYVDATFTVPIDPAFFPELGKTPGQDGTYFVVLHEDDFDGTEPDDSTNQVREVVSFGSAQLTVTRTEFTPDPPPPPPPPGPDTQGPINRTIYADWTGAAPSQQDRNWCPEWTTPASSMCLSRRQDGSLAILFGTNDGTGRILRLDNSTRNDDGEAIDAFYQTAFVGGSSGRNTFQYLTMSTAGNGELDIAGVLPDGITRLPLKGRELVRAPLRDQEWPGLRILTERVAWRFGTFAVDSWFKLRKLVGYARPAPWSRTLGPPS